jgi:hypothetical protein
LGALTGICELEPTAVTGDSFATAVEPHVALDREAKV